MQWCKDVSRCVINWIIITLHPQTAQNQSDPWSDSVEAIRVGDKALVREVNVTLILQNRPLFWMGQIQNPLKFVRMGILTDFSGLLDQALYS